MADVTFVLRVIYCEPHCFLGHLAEAILPAVLRERALREGGGFALWYRDSINKLGLERDGAS